MTPSIFFACIPSDLPVAPPFQMVPAFNGQTVCCGNDLDTEQAQPLPGFYRKNRKFETRNVKPLHSVANRVLLYPNTPQKITIFKGKNPITKSFPEFHREPEIFVQFEVHVGFGVFPVLSHFPHVPSGQPTLAARVAPGDSTLPPVPWNLGVGTFQVDRCYPESQIHSKLVFKQQCKNNSSIVTSPIGTPKAPGIHRLSNVTNPFLRLKLLAPNRALIIFAIKGQIKNTSKTIRCQPFLFFFPA